MDKENSLLSPLAVKRSLPLPLRAVADIPGIILGTGSSNDILCRSYCHFVSQMSKSTSDGWHSMDNTEATWSSKAPTVAGMLDDNTDVNDIDLKHSNDLLNTYIKAKVSGSRCLDVAAGIGRVTKNCLSNYFDIIDLCEPNQDFINASYEYLDGISVGNRYCEAIQTFNFENRYDCVWVQWCCGFATDDYFISFLNKCYEALNEGGRLIIRDNTSGNEAKWMYDPEDGTLYRNKEMYDACVACSKFKTLKSSYWSLSSKYLPMIDLVLVK